MIHQSHFPDKSDTPVLSSCQWVGILSMPPLPGTAGWTGTLDRFWDQLAQEALALSSAGVDALVLENTADIPYRHQDRLDSLATALFCRAVFMVKDLTQKPVGLSILPNDPVSALSVALVTEAAFVRVRLLAGAMQTPSGLLSANPASIIDAAHRLRQQDLQPNAWPDLWLDAPVNFEASDALRAVLPSLSAYWPLSGLIYDDIQALQHRQPDHPEMALPRAAWRLPKEMASFEAFAPLLEGEALAHCQSIWLGPGFEKTMSTARYGRATLDAVQLECFVQKAKKRLEGACLKFLPGLHEFPHPQAEPIAPQSTFPLTS
ncbi:MAG: BtpA/SgcQ family protein [Vampirovibrionales bacterium]|nr:BtpA/SgcQ family protein [Vampirovibrionales bacterium]